MVVKSNLPAQTMQGAIRFEETGHHAAYVFHQLAPPAPRISGACLMAMLDPAASLTIFGYRWVPEFAQGHVRDLRPRWACEEAGIPYREELIDVTDKPASYFAEQPWGQVPAIIDGDLHIFESGATLLHLGLRSATLLPPGGQPRAAALSWLMAALNTLDPVMMELVNINQFARGEDWAALRRPSLEAFARRRLAPLEQRLGGEEWLAGAFSIADIAMTTVLRALDDSALAPEFPQVAAYIARAMARPACERALGDQLAAYARHPSPDQQGA